jgi:hypothetical protein
MTAPKRTDEKIVFRTLAILWLASGALAVTEMIQQERSFSLAAVLVLSILGFLGFMCYAAGRAGIAKLITAAVAVAYLALYAWGLVRFTPMRNYANSLLVKWNLWQDYISRGEPLVGASIFFDQWLMPFVLVAFLAWLFSRSSSRSAEAQ